MDFINYVHRAYLINGTTGAHKVRPNDVFKRDANVKLYIVGVLDVTILSIINEKH